MAQTTEVMVAGRKVEGKWEAALISKGRFVRALTGDDLFKMVAGQVNGLLSAPREDETTVSIRIEITEGEKLEEIV